MSTSVGLPESAQNSCDWIVAVHLLLEPPATSFNPVQQNVEIDLGTTAAGITFPGTPGVLVLQRCSNSVLQSLRAAQRKLRNQQIVSHPKMDDGQCHLSKTAQYRTGRDGTEK